MSKVLLFSSAGPRLSVVVSLIAHAAIVAAAGAHGAHGPRAQAPRGESTVAVEVLPLAVPEPHIFAEANDPPDHAAAHPHTHTHPYPLPPHHDDVPHDPSIDHRHPAAAEAAAEAAPVMAAQSTFAPHFSMVIGAGAESAGGPTSEHAVAAKGAPAPSVAHEGEREYDGPAVSVPARLASRMLPEYPEAARAAGLEAEVALEIVVDASGHVAEARVLRGAGRSFDESALRAIRAAHFTPAQHEGAPVRVRMSWTVAFRLE